MKISKPQSDYVERVGRWWEGVSGSRTAGRILGWLMICDPPHRSASELAAELQISTGSVSTQTTALEQIGLVERITFPGDRASYYQLLPHVWEKMFWSEHERIRDMRDLAVAAEAVLPDERPDRVTALRRISEFLIAEWPGLMKRLDEHIEDEHSEKETV